MPQHSFSPDEERLRRVIYCLLSGICSYRRVLFTRQGDSESARPRAMTHRAQRCARQALLARCGCGRCSWSGRAAGCALLGSGRRLGLSWSGSGARFGGGRAGLCSVIVHIPACAFEVQTRRSEWALEHAVALRAFKLRLGAETLNLFKAVAALGTPIRIQRQSSHPPERLTHFTYCIGRTGNYLQMAVLPHAFSSELSMHGDKNRC